MKIVITGGFTYPLNADIRKLFEEDEKLIYSADHNHPWIFNLANSLKKIKGNEIHVVSMTGDIKRDISFEYDDIHYNYLKSTDMVLKVLTVLNSNKWKFHKLFRKINPDIIHGHARGRESFYALTSKYPTVITNHGQIDEHYDALGRNAKDLRYNMHKNQEKRVNSLMRYCISVSPNCTNDCLKYLSVNNIFEIENPISLDFFENKSIVFGNNILFIGSITELKQVHELIKAVEIIPDCELDIISTTNSGSYFNMLCDYIKQKGISNKVRFLGAKSQNDIAGLLSKCLALCLPSKYESFGMVLAEAMAMGKPVIGSNIGGIPSLINDGINGYLIEPGNINQIAEKINFLISNKHIARKLGENGKRTAFERWHPDKIAEKTMEVYMKILYN